MFIMLTLFNTLTNKKEKFVPHSYPYVSLYVCGITPYDHSHIGHARSAISFDVLYRVLSASGYVVSYCRNFTDIDDKLLVKANNLLGDQHRYQEIAVQYISEFQECMAQLNCVVPTYEPRVTENIPAIIDFIKGLMAAGYAYAVDGDVYFRIERFKEYGKLSHRHIEQLATGTRVGVEPNKEHPLDFALWKSELGNSFWQSPWGHGRPGWHIECSALVKTYLGTEIDIHGGGLDIMFPHHENEIAQSEALNGVPLARYWVHNGMVQVHHEKMSKSLGNVIILPELLAHIDPMVFRFYLLNHHYRSPLDFSFEYLTNIKKTYQRLCKVLADVVTDPIEPATLLMPKSSFLERMVQFLYDDLNTAGMFGYLFETMDEWSINYAERVIIGSFLKQVCGLTLTAIVEKSIDITPEIQSLIDAREHARMEKNWALADSLRDQLAMLGVVIKDKKM